MTNLLNIEASFLNMPEVKQGLNLTEIKRLNATLSNGQKKKFEQSYLNADFPLGNQS